ncbi:type II toxin-antitoxin system RelE/ParE family toxin [Microbulbifer sp. THAF38]|uniref:type II toxin-antitoxin system RelE/ParE family toxin n=1 Tax=Microbulbifer sp. THAF38 TaxID=2587856 RepID=UPI0012A8358A|nr:type II toxin-antitoxin system RelE/ParE family toxin [Microbulbifer sp. THAF38]QFT56480.1 hypothetical protein FIU95_18185 [Microbulbifer sp. THAF38]
MARLFMTMDFRETAIAEGISPDSLRKAGKRLEQGSFDAHIGKNVYKQRVPANGRGKRGGARTIVAFRSQSGDKVFFLYGYSKKRQDNIDDDDVKTLEILAARLLNASDEVIAARLNEGYLVEVTVPAEATEKV